MKTKSSIPDVPDREFHVHTHDKNRRLRGLSGMYLQSRNASYSSDRVVKVADSLGCLGWGVQTGCKNPRRQKIVKNPQFLWFLGQVGTGLIFYAVKLSIKLSMSFSQRQKILKCLWSKNFELQKCGHTEKSLYGLNLSIIVMFWQFME